MPGLCTICESCLGATARPPVRWHPTASRTISSCKRTSQVPVASVLMHQLAATNAANPPRVGPRRTFIQHINRW
jgi:hypothetical protein